jgi:ketol-acid reductoisomerase
MRYSVSDTAEHGDYTGGPRIVTDQTRAEMKKMLEEIRSGKYAEGWIQENASGRKWFNAQRQHERSLRIEKVGAELRALMPFLRPVTITDEETVGAGARRMAKARVTADPPPPMHASRDGCPPCSRSARRSPAH